MPGQEKIKPQRREGDPDETPDVPVPAAPQASASDIDDILDEIDGVLESNAEEFVRGFVQKGGQ